MSRVKDEIAAKEAEISELEKSMNEGLSLVEKVVEYENDFDSQVWLFSRTFWYDSYRMTSPRDHWATSDTNCPWSN